jgi:dipeptidyl aminopeptidase/acylaminoacyl peptidase
LEGFWLRTELLVLGLLAGLLCSHPSFVTAQVSNDNNLEAAFIRNGNLWVKTKDKERQVTRDKSVSSSKWSYDGRWIAYVVTDDTEFHKLNTLRVRNLKTHQDTMVFAFDKSDSDMNIAWSPNSDILAFQNGTLLNDIDMRNLREQGFRNVSLGVSQFAWLPDGSGFMVSSSAHLLPDGWTRAHLYTIPLTRDKSLLNHAVVFYDLPKEVSLSGTKVLAIGTSTFKWAPDRKWIAFIVHPTASWSADSNILCVLSVHDKHLIPIAEMLDRNDWFEWAPKSSELAFIQGGGRSITENKRIAVASAPQFRAVKAFTPKGFVDNAFTWNDDMSLTVSRVREGEFKRKLPLEQLPSLYNVQLQNKNVHKITTPPEGMGDFQPMWDEKSKHLFWVRSNEGSSSVWRTDKARQHQTSWIINIDRGQWPPYWSMWNKLLDIQ